MESVLILGVFTLFLSIFTRFLVLIFLRQKNNGARIYTFPISALEISFFSNIWKCSSSVKLCKFNSLDVVEPKSLKPCSTLLEIGIFVKMKNLLFKGALSSWIRKRGSADQNSFHSSQGWEILKKKMSKIKRYTL